MKILAADEVTSVRLAALVKINDQAVLAELATTDRNGDVRCAAVTRLTDQAVLAKLAATDEIWDVRLLAVKKLAEQQLLAALAVDGKYSDVRQAAVERLTDQDLLVRIAVHNKNPDTQRAALEKITGQAEVAGIVLASPEFNSLVREAPKLTARNLLARVPVILEKALWAKAEADGRDAGLYREYLNRFPQTAHSAAAQDCVDWAAAEACGLTAVQTYLAAHPQGRFAARGREYLQAAGEIDAWTQELLDKQAWEMVKPQLKGSHGSQPSWVYGWISSGSTRLVYRGATSKDGRMKVLLDDNSRLAALGRVYEYCDGKWFPAKERVFQTKKEQ